MAVFPCNTFIATKCLAFFLQNYSYEMVQLSPSSSSAVVQHTLHFIETCGEIILFQLFCLFDNNGVNILQML